MILLDKAVRETKRCCFYTNLLVKAYCFYLLQSSTMVSATAMKATTVKSAAVKMMNTEVVAVEMVVSVIMVVMPPAKDKVAATVWSPTAVIGSIVRTGGIASGKIGALTSG